METKMGFRHKFAYSFYDFAAYKDFVIEGLGKAIFYTFLVTLIFSTITNFKTIKILNSEISSVQADFIDSAQNFELKNGLLTVDYNEPLYYKRNDIMFIVDTSGKTTSSALDTYNNGIYINSNTLTVRENYRTLETLNFSDFDDLVLTNTDIQSILSASKFFIPLILLILNPIVSFLINLILVFAILAPISLSISSLMGLKFNYSKACTLSSYAITLPLLLEALLNVSGIDMPEFFMIFLLVAVVYCGLAIKEIKNTDKSNLKYMK